MTTPPGIRRARIDDAEAIAQIYNQGIEDRVATFETELRTARHIEMLLRENAALYPAMVVVRDGALVAWAWVTPYSGRPCYAGIVEFSVYVDRSARGTGAGRAVLSALLAACEAQGFWKVLSRVFPENEASRALCRRLGFREVGVYRHHAQLDGVWRDVVIVEKCLGDAAASSPA